MAMNELVVMIIIHDKNGKWKMMDDDERSSHHGVAAGAVEEAVGCKQVVRPLDGHRQSPLAVTGARVHGRDGIQIVQLAWSLVLWPQLIHRGDLCALRVEQQLRVPVVETARHGEVEEKGGRIALIYLFPN